MPKSQRKPSLLQELMPGIRHGQSIPFYELDPYIFQELSRDLFDTESSIATCSIYGVSGQSQEGIDLLALRTNSDGIEVGQCKCYEDFSASEIRDASDEFMKYWDRWSAENVKRFVLFVACDLNRTQQQKQILAEKQRFAALGVAYEVWSSATIRRKLQPHRAIVATYLKGDYWVNEICGNNFSQPPITSSESTYSNALNTAVAVQFESLMQMLSEETKENLETMRNRWREGNRAEARDWLIRLKLDTIRWRTLPSQTKAQILRFEASLQLDTNSDLKSAKELAEAAYDLDPSAKNEARIRAIIALHEIGPGRAIEYLQAVDDIDSLNLLCALHLELNDRSSSQNIIDQIEKSGSANAETYRLKALLNLLLGNLQQATELIEKAIAIAPKWTSLRFAKAIICYYSAVSPAALPTQLLPGPEPVDWIMVKRDEFSTRQVREASTIFKDLINIDANTSQLGHLHAWSLACLLIDPQKQKEAYDEAQRVISSNPTNFYAIAWILTRNLDIDLATSIRSLDELLSQEKATIPHVIALVGILSKRRDYNGALKILSRTKQLFSTQIAMSTWALWNVQVLVQAKRHKRAQQVANRFMDGSNEIRQAQYLIWATDTKTHQNKSKLLNYLEEQYLQTKDPAFILQACEMEYQNKNWEYVISQADLLLRSIDTAEIVRLLAISMYNAKQPAQCLSLLEAKLAMFGNQGLPADMRRLRAACLQAMGKLKEAITEVESLSAEEKSIEDIRQVAQMYVQIGDLKKLALIGRQLIAMPEIYPDDALWMAQVLQQEDSLLAKSLWRKAQLQKLPDELVKDALFLGYNLELDKDLSGVNQKFYELASQGAKGTKFFTFEELIEFNKKLETQRAELETLYKEGKLPIHSLVERENIQLADLYMEYLADKETKPNPLKQPYLLICHGNKNVDPLLIKQAKAWSLHLDITSILLAEHLGILDIVLEEFAPIHIPFEAIPVLLEMRGKVLHHQPSQITTSQEIISLSQSGRLQVFEIETPSTFLSTETGISIEHDRSALFQFVQERGGYLLDFASEIKKYVQSQSAINEAYLTTCKNIARALLELGKLSEPEYEKMVREFGPEEGITLEDSRLPEIGKNIYCYANTIDILSSVNLLKHACEHYTIFIQRSHLESIQNSLLYQQKRKSTFHRLGELIEKLRTAIESGKVQIIPYSIDTSSIDQDPKHHLSGLRSLYGFAPKKTDVIWIDDRFMNSFSNRDGVPIIGINEMFSALLEIGKIDLPQYYELRNRLRAANLRFVSINASEIIHHLLKSTIRSGKLIETPDLEIIRKYIAAVLVQGTILQKPVSNDDSVQSQGEIGFVLQLSRAVAEAIATLWTSAKVGDDRRLIFADWLLTNLYTSHLGLANLIGLQQSQENDFVFTAINYELFVTQALTMDLPASAQSNSVRKEYLNWIFERLMRNHFEINPESLDETARLLRLILQHSRESANEEETPIDLANAVYQQFCSFLPQPLFDKLLEDVSFKQSLGFTSVITIADLEIQAEDFWIAAYDAANGREHELEPIAGTPKIFFRPLTNDNNEFGILVYDKGDNDPFLLQGPELELLVDDNAKRRKVLEANRSWFDCDDDEFKKIVNRITSVKQPRERVEVALEWKNSHLGVYYHKLHKKLRQQARLMYSDFIPDNLAGMTRHYRLHSSSDSPYMPNSWDNFAADLLRSESIYQTVYRLWGVPIALPQCAIDAVRTIDSGKKKSLIKELLRTAQSPIAFIHLTQLVLATGLGDPALERLAELRLSYLTSDPFSKEIDALLTIAKWVDYRLNLQPGIKNYPERTRLILVWSHSHHLYSILASLGAKSEWIQQTFSQAFQLVANVFDTDSKYESDVSNPHNVNSKILASFGMVYCTKNYSGTLSTALREKIKQLVTTEAEGQLLPHPLLLHRSATIQNALDSYLGYSLAAELMLLIAREVAETFQENYLLQFIQYQVESLEENLYDRSSWINISTIIRTGHQEPEFKAELLDVLIKTSFIDLYKKSLLLGATAIEAAAYEAMIVENRELAQYVTTQIFAIAKYMSEEYPELVIRSLSATQQADINYSIGMMIETILHLSKLPANPEERAIEFREICQRLLGIWDYTKSLLKPIVQVFCEILPPSQAKHMWTVQEMIRAL